MITSVDNPRLKRLKKLSRQKKARFQEKAFVIEGPKLIAEAVASGVELLEVFVSATPQGVEALTGILAGIDAESVEASLFDQMSDTQTPQPALAIARMPEMLMSSVAQASSHVLVLHEVRDPGNLGTIIRTAEASGAQAVVLTGDCVELYNPKVVRAAAGSIYRLPIVIQHSIEEALAQLSSAGWVTSATVVHAADAVGHVDAKLDKAAIVLGNETHGLADRAVKACDQKVTIITPGPTESLNLAAAAAVLSFEAHRQQCLAFEQR